MTDQNSDSIRVGRELTTSGRERREFLLYAGLTAAGVAPLVAGEVRPARSPAGGCADDSAPMQDVDGKVAFITGGSRGIGLGMARAFTRAGMKVVITYRNQAHLEEALQQLKEAGDRVHAVQVDVTDRAGMAQAAEQTVRRFGKVHVLVNNAGLGVLVGFGTVKPEDWDEAWNVNVNGVFNGLHAFLPKIRAHGEGGQIVTTASTAGLIASSAGVYSTTKFAVVGMMEALRQELLDTNVGVSVFCPGAVNTNPEVIDSRGVRITLGGAERSAAMDPLEAGERVLRGIRNNDLYILSHPEYRQGIQDRCDALLASIPAEAAPAARLELERSVLRSPAYLREAERLRCRAQRG